MPPAHHPALTFSLIAFFAVTITACGVKGSLHRPEAERPKADTLPQGESRTVPEANPEQQLEELREYRP